MLHDVIRMSGFPIVIVADAGLGAINACVLTAGYARSLQLPVAGFLLNHFDAASSLHLDNKAVIEQLSGLPILGCIADDQPDIFRIGCSSDNPDSDIGIHAVNEQSEQLYEAY